MHTHLIQILRDYLGETQQSLAMKADITQADLNEIESGKVCGSIEKFCRLSKTLDIPVDVLIKNDYSGVPGSFFEAHKPAPYLEGRKGIGRKGEEAVFAMEQEKLNKKFSTLGRLVLPYFKMKTNSPGYDILSFDDNAKPIFIEVKTCGRDEEKKYSMTTKEHDVAKKLTDGGESYFIYRFTNFGNPKKQVLHIESFQELLTGRRMEPKCYICTTFDRPATVSGIAYHRRCGGLSQIALAEQLGIMPHHLCLYEKKQTSLSGKHLFEALKALGYHN